MFTIVEFIVGTLHYFALPIYLRKKLNIILKIYKFKLYNQIYM